ncbi:unnamed protein product [Rotaria sp. Silwood2]|nr:unnamed protein product [Rotaria sp. Silwood2]CAF4032282.1 unnamed protein product [Rotaria sp. Silwood2]
MSSSGYPQSFYGHIEFPKIDTDKNYGHSCELDAFFQYYCALVSSEYNDYMARLPLKASVRLTLLFFFFYFHENLDHCWLLSNDDWAEYPKILAYMKAFRELPELKKYFDSEHAKRPINGKMAKFGGVVVQHETKKKEEPAKTEENITLCC